MERRVLTNIFACNKIESIIKLEVEIQIMVCGGGKGEVQVLDGPKTRKTQIINSTNCYRSIMKIVWRTITENFQKITKKCVKR